MDNKKLNALVKKLSTQSLHKVETKKIQEDDICYADSVEETIRFHDEISKLIEQRIDYLFKPE